MEPHIEAFMRNLARWQGIASSRDLGSRPSQQENSARQTAKRRGWVTYDKYYWRMTESGHQALRSQSEQKKQEG